MRGLALLVSVSLSNACVTAALTGGTQGDAATPCELAPGCTDGGHGGGSIVLPLALLAAIGAAPLIVLQIQHAGRRAPPVQRSRD